MYCYCKKIESHDIKDLIFLKELRALDFQSNKTLIIKNTRQQS